MSKDIAIRDNDGQEHSYQGVSQLVVRTNSSSSATWVPEEELNMGRIDVTRNGEYVPFNDNVYAYYKVSVLVPGGNPAEVEVVDSSGNVSIQYVSPEAAGVGGSIVATDPNDGNLYYVTVESDGYLKYTKIPSRARVTRPTKDLYHNGESIDWSGCVLSLLYQDGTTATEWDGGSISYGGSNWNSHVVPYSEPLSRLDGSAQTHPVYIRPFWLRDGLLLPYEYGLMALVTVFVED